MITTHATQRGSRHPAQPATHHTGGSAPSLQRVARPRSRRWQTIRTVPPLVWVSLAVLSAFILAGIAAPIIAPHDPVANDLLARLQPPAFADGGSRDHLLGTDELGRDVLSRVMHGARLSLAIAALGTAFGALFGAMCGLVSGFRRGRLDSAMMLLVDAYVALPFIIIALSLVAVLGSSVRVLTLLAALAGWASYTRVTRGLVLRSREEQYVLAARSLGAGPARLMLRHLLPNVLAPLIVLTTLELSTIILLEASLSFLGIGIQPPAPAWGLMVSEGRDYLHTAWWVGVIPGVAIMLVAIAISYTGDWLRDALDPTQRQRT